MRPRPLRRIGVGKLGLPDLAGMLRPDRRRVLVRAAADQELLRCDVRLRHGDAAVRVRVLRLHHRLHRDLRRRGNVFCV